MAEKIAIKTITNPEFIKNILTRSIMTYKVLQKKKK